MTSTIVRGGALALAAMLVVACGHEAEEAPHCACQHDHEHAGLPALGPLDGASLYQLDAAITDQDERPFSLVSLRGEPVLVLMFYGSCTTVCPLLISEVVRVDEALSPEERARLRVVLVTFDPDNDTPERLRALAAERSLPTPRYSLLRGDQDAVRELAMALGVQYRRTADGQFVHSAIVTLLDAEGRVAVQADGVDAPLEPVVARARELLAAHAEGHGATREDER